MAHLNLKAKLYIPDMIGDRERKDFLFLFLAWSEASRPTHVFVGGA